MMIFSSEQIRKLKTVYFDAHKTFRGYRIQIFYSVIYEDEYGMNVMEGLYTFQEVEHEKRKIRMLNPKCKMYIESDNENRCSCTIQ